MGSKGKVSIPCFDTTPVILTKDGQSIEIPYKNPENIQFNLIRQVVEAIQGKGECVSTGESAMRTNKVLKKVVKGFYKR